MSQSDTKHAICETIAWHGDWQSEISQEQREEAQSLFAEMMANYAPDHLKHVTDHACEAIQTVLDQEECLRGRLDEMGPIFEFSFRRRNTLIYLSALFLDGGRNLSLAFSSEKPTPAKT